MILGSCLRRGKKQFLINFTYNNQTKTLMNYNPLCFMFPFGYPYHFPFYPPPPLPPALSPKNQKLQVADLESQVIPKSISSAKIEANEKNQQKTGKIAKILGVEDEISSQYLQQRRNYRRRRNWLKKAYTCDLENCNKKYSSNMALRNHKRDVHGIRIRERRAPR